MLADSVRKVSTGGRVSDSLRSARLWMSPNGGATNPEEPMSTNKYLCMYRGAPSQTKPSPAQMQEMFSAFNEWKEKFKDSILDMGSKLKSSGKVVTATTVTDGPFAEGKEI